MGRQKVRCGMAGHGAGCLVQSGDGDDVGMWGGCWKQGKRGGK